MVTKSYKLNTVECLCVVVHHTAPRILRRLLNQDSSRVSLMMFQRAHKAGRRLWESGPEGKKPIAGRPHLASPGHLLSAMTQAAVRHRPILKDRNNDRGKSSLF